MSCEGLAGFANRSAEFLFMVRLSGSITGDPW